MCANQSNAFNEKQAVFDVIFTWARHISNSVWLVTSFFIGLNFIAIKIVFSDLGGCYIKSHLDGLSWRVRLFLVFVVFSTLWLIPALCVLYMMAISAKLSSLPKEGPDSLQITKLYDNLEKVGLTNILVGITFPYGWITTAFTILFLLAWIWIFFYFIP